MRIYETNKKIAKKHKNNYLSLLYVLPYIIVNIFAEDLNNEAKSVIFSLLLRLWLKTIAWVSAEMSHRGTE